MLTSLRDLLSQTLRAIGFERRSQALRAVDVWPEAVGPRWAARTLALDVRAGRLIVATDGAAVSQELSLRRSAAIAALNRRLGEGTISEIQFVVRPDVVRGEPGPTPAATAREHLGASPEVEAEAREEIERHLRDS